MKTIAEVREALKGLTFDKDFDEVCRLAILKLMDQNETYRNNMQLYRNNPDGAENRLATKQNDAEIFALNMQAEKLKEQMNSHVINEEIDRMMDELKELRLENAMLRQMKRDVDQLNKALLADRQEMQACTGLPELKPITTELLPSPSPIAPYPKGRWQHL